MIKNTLYTIIIICSLAFSQTTYTVNAGMNGSSFYFNPSNLTIEQGDVVIWINDGGCHDVNGNINSITNSPFDNPETFDSPTTCETGAEIFSYTFNLKEVLIFLLLTLIFLVLTSFWINEFGKLIICCLNHLSNLTLLKFLLTIKLSGM